MSAMSLEVYDRLQSEHVNTVIVLTCAFSIVVPVENAGVGADRIEVLDTSFGDASRVIAHWGVGARELLGK